MLSCRLVWLTLTVAALLLFQPPPPQPRAS